VRRLLVTANIVPSSPILVTLMMQALSPSETSVITRSTRRNIPEEAIHHGPRREKLKFYMVGQFDNNCTIFWGQAVIARLPLLYQWYIYHKQTP
jgi:hypothetical protein